MSLKSFMILCSVSFAILGLYQTLIPNILHPMWGIASPDDAVIFMSQRWGVMTLGISIMTWLSRNQSLVETKPLLIGSCFVATMTGGTTALALSTGLINGPLAWFAVFFEFALAVGFGLFLLQKKTS